MNYAFLFIFLTFFASNIFAQESKCHTKNIQDSYSLSLTWPHSFCATHQNPECNHLQQKHDFTLHGLWPNKKECGINYEFCGKVKTPNAKCKYPNIKITKSTFNDLKEIMPSAKYGTCLEKHEWWKHGTCTNFNEEQYFMLSIKLTKQFNTSKFVTDYIKENLGKAFILQDFYKAFDKSFGTKAHKSLELYCQGNNLEELRIHLPKNLDEGDLQQLIGKVHPTIKKDRCTSHMNLGII